MNHLFLAYGMAFAWLFSGFLFVPRAQVPTVAGRVPWAIAIGGFLWAYGQFLYNRVGCILSRPALQIIIFGIVSFGMAWLLRKRPRWNLKWLDEPATWMETLAVGVLFLAFGVAVMESTVLPLYHVDAVTCFGLKAKALFLSGTFRTPFFYERGIAHVQPDYPLLVPYLESLYYQLCGTIDDVLVKQVFLIYAVCLVLLVYQNIRLRWDRPFSLLVTAVFASTPLFLKDQDTQVVSGGADVVFMLYETGAVLAAAHWITSGASGWRRLAVLSSLGCLFCKPQGLVFCLLLWGGLWFLLDHDRRSWRIGAVQLTAFSLPWLITARFLPREVIFPPLVLSKDQLIQGLHKLPALLIALAHEPWRINQWGLFWPTLAALLYFKQQPLSSSVRFIWMMVGLQALSYFGVYLIYPQPIQWWIASSLTRWLTHGTALLMIATAWNASEQLSQG